MSDKVLDVKDIKEAVQDVVQLSEKKWQTEREADKKAFDDKMSAAIDKIAEDQKAVVEATEKKMQDQFDTALVDLKKGHTTNKKVTFKTALAEGLKSNFEEMQGKMKDRKLDHIIDLKDFNYTDFTDYEDFVTDFRQPILNPYSSFHWRQVVPLGTTDKGFISYPKEGSTGGAADTWEHAGDSATAKPQINPAMAKYTVDVEWIAGLIKGIPTSMLEDLPWMTSYLQNKGMNELMKAEDLQIQEGSGTPPDLDGFFTGTNVAEYDGSKTIFIEQLIDAAYRQIANSFYNADKVVISNADKVSILLTEKSTGAGYGLPGGTVSVVNGMINVAGLQLFSNPTLDEGEALIGDFRESQLVIRSAPRLRFFDQNATDAEKNQIMIRIEERIALAIFSSLAFVKLPVST